MLKEWAENNNIELDEKFKFKGSNRLYRIHNIGSEIDINLVIQEKYNNNWEISDISVNVLENANIVKLPWRPDKGDVCYSPTINSSGINYFKFSWGDTCADKYLYKLGLICKTEEDAKQKYNKMVEFCKKEFVQC